MFKNEQEMEQRILIGVDQKQIDNQQEEIIEIFQIKQKSNSSTQNELNNKYQNLELELKNAKQNNENLIKQNKSYQEKIKTLEEQETTYIQCLDQKLMQIQNLEEQNQLLESQLQKQHEQILSMQLIISDKQSQINNFQIKITEHIQEKQQLRSQLQQQNKLYENNIKITQDSYDINNNIQYDNSEYQIKNSNYSKVDQKLIQKLLIKDNIILYLQNQLADLKVTHILTNQENNNNRTKLNIKTSESKNSNHKNIIIQTSDQSLIQSQTLNSKVLPPKGDQKMIQSQFNFQSEKYRFSNNISQINIKNLENLQRNNKSISNLNESITDTPNKNYQNNSHYN